MIIPKKFQLMGRVIDVQLMPDYPASEYHGLCQPDSNRILVGDTVPRTKQEHVFLHELVHFIFHMIGERECYENERLIDSFAGLLHQYMVSQKGSQ